MSLLVSLLYNAHRDPTKTSPATPDDFNPYARRAKPTAAPALALSARDYRGLFCVD